VQRSVRGLLVWAASASRLSLAERANSHGLDLVLGLAMAAPLTAPLGSWMRRGSLWTPTARWHRRRSRSLDRVSVYDLALCLGLTWSVLGTGGSAVAVVRTCTRPSLPEASFISCG
jgi:hypothetical protein